MKSTGLFFAIATAMTACGGSAQFDESHITSTMMDGDDPTALDEEAAMDVTDEKGIKVNPPTDGPHAHLLATIPTPKLQSFDGINNETPSSTDILLKLFQTLAAASLENPLATKYRELAQQAAELRAKYSQEHEARNSNVALDDAEFPQIFTSVKTAAQAAVRVARRREKINLVVACDPSLKGAFSPDAMDDEKVEEQLDDLHRTYTAQENLRLKVNRQLNALIATAGERSGYKENDLTVIRRGSDKFTLSADGDLLMGYAAGELLHFSQIFARSANERQYIAPYSYQGKTDFALSEKELNDLGNWIAEADKWQQDFRNTVGSLVGPDTVQLGQKSLAEFLSSSGFSPEVMRLFAGVPASRIALLFNTVSIDLESHRDRDELKRVFERAFRDAHLVARNQQVKGFLTGTYRANIGVDQLAAICPTLNKLLKVTQLWSGPFPDISFLSAPTDFDDSPLGMMKQFKVSQLNETISLMIGRPEQEYNGPNARLRQDILNQLNAQTNLQEVEGKSLELYELLLSRYVGLNFYMGQAGNNRNPIEVTPHQIRELYLVAGRPVVQIEYEGNIRHKNIPALIATLKESKAVQSLHDKYPGLTAVLDQFRDKLVKKINGYHRLEAVGYFGQSVFDEGLDALETVVAKIVYAEQTKVTSASVVNALHQIAGIVGDELVEGCATGFKGRMTQILTNLTYETGNAVLDHLGQERSNAYQGIVQAALAAQRNYAGAAAGMNDVHPIVGYTPPANAQAQRVNERGYYQPALDAEGQRVLEKFVDKINPVQTYHSLRKYFGDRFWQLNTEKDDAGMYLLLSTLGFGEDKAALDKSYRVDGKVENRWQYAFFQQDLPAYLLPYMLKLGIFYIHEAGAKGTVYLKSAADGREYRVSPIPQYHRPAPSPQPVEQRAWAGFGYQPESSLADVRYGTGG